MVYDFDCLPDRRPTESYKWHTYDEDVLPMFVADLDFVSPEPVIRALHQRVEHSVFGYPYVPPALRQAVVERLARLYRWEVSPEALIFIPGVVPGLNLACRAAVPSEGAVLIQTPVYPPFLKIAANASVLHQEMELFRCPAGPERGQYRLDWQTFEAAITPQTRLFVLCNPHNPIGRVFHREELESMAELCLQHDLIICSDEIHCDLVFPGHPHLPIAALGPEIARCTITLMAPSKTYNLAGLHCAYAVIPDETLRDQFRRAHLGLVGGLNLLGLVAAQAALQEGDEWLEQLLVYLEANRDFTYNFVNSELPGVHMALPEGTYLAWLDCREASLPGSPYEFFLEKARVATLDGKHFGRGGEGFIRLNFGCPRSMLAEALERMKTALHKSPRG